MCQPSADAHLKADVCHCPAFAERPSVEGGRVQKAAVQGQRGIDKSDIPNLKYAVLKRSF